MNLPRKEQSVLNSDHRENAIYEVDLCGDECPKQHRKKLNGSSVNIRIELELKDVRCKSVNYNLLTNLKLKVGRLNPDHFNSFSVII